MTSIPSLVSFNVSYCLPWCVTLAMSLDMNSEQCFCSLRLRVCSLAEIKRFKSRIRIRTIPFMTNIIIAYMSVAIVWVRIKSMEDKHVTTFTTPVHFRFLCFSTCWWTSKVTVNLCILYQLMINFLLILSLLTFP